jgi:hypothetical protein
MSGLKLNIINTALQAFLFASSPRLLFTKNHLFLFTPPDFAIRRFALCRL